MGWDRWESWFLLCFCACHCCFHLKNFKWNFGEMYRNVLTKTTFLKKLRNFSQQNFLIGNRLWFSDSIHVYIIYCSSLIGLLFCKWPLMSVVKGIGYLSWNIIFHSKIIADVTKYFQNYQENGLAQVLLHPD